MKDINHGMLVNKLAIKLSNIAVPPTWARYVKTGHGKQRPPVREDWWQVRAAAVMLSVEKLGPVGVSKLSVKYGNRKNKGYKPEKEATGSRSILRKILQQLEAAGLVKQSQKDSHKGRVITTKGIKLINEAVKECKAELPAETKKEKAAEPSQPHSHEQAPEKKKPKKKE